MVSSQNSLLSENYIGTHEWQCRYIRGSCCFVCRTKHRRKTRAFWGISLYHGMYDVIAEVSH
jgi:hypothetical protein